MIVIEIQVEATGVKVLMEYQQNQAHVQAFLVDAAFDRLSKNQQEHAQRILQQVNQLMADRHQLDDCHWTGAALAAVLDHELYQDGRRHIVR